jgi:hypothetical protein
MASGVTSVLAIYRLHRGRALRLAKRGSKSCPPRSTPIPVEVVLAGSRAKKNSSISGTEKDLTHTEIIMLLTPIANRLMLKTTIK